MITLIHREFVVDVSIETAWQHLTRVEQWPSWAKHIKYVELDPPGELTSKSKGIFHLKNGVKSTFQMTQFNPPRNWKWVGPFLWLMIHYDHKFEPIDDHHTKLIWVIGCTGFGTSIIGRLFAVIYNLNLNKAIPYLKAEINAISQ